MTAFRCCLAAAERACAGLVAAVCLVGGLVEHGHAQVVISPVASQLFAKGNVRAFARQADGKMVIGGAFSTVAGVSRTNLARLNADGTLDVTWQADLTPTDVVNAIVIDQAGYAIVGGSFTSVGVTARHALARLSPSNGAPDPVWLPEPNAAVTTLARGPAGSLFVGGGFTAIGGQPRTFLAKLGADGTADSAWATTPNAAVSALVTDDLGNLFVGGSFTAVDSIVRNYLARVDAASGVVDPQWDPSPDGPVSHLAHGVDPGNGARYIFAAGSFGHAGGQAQYLMARVLADADGHAPSAYLGPYFVPVTALATDPSGWLYVAGNGGFGSGPTLGRLAMSWDGGLDSVWSPGVSDLVNMLAFLPEQRIAIGGEILAAGGAPSGGFTSVRADTGAAVGTWSAFQKNGRVNAMVRDSQNRLIVGGDFSQLGSGMQRRNLLRINADDSLDGSWTTATNAPVTAFAIAADDTLYIAGPFTRIGSATTNGLARISSAGTPDASWQPPSAAIARLLLDAANDRLYVAGTFTSIGGYGRMGIARVSTAGAGAVDSVWNPAPGLPPYGDFDPPPDLALIGSSIFYCGPFSQIGGEFRSGLARIATEGTGAVDPLWNPAPDLSVTTVLAGGNDTLYVGGFFHYIGGASRRSIARLSLQGTGAADASWYPSLAQESPAVEAREGSPVRLKPSTPANSGIHSLARTNSTLWAAGSSFVLQGAYFNLGRLSVSNSGLVDPNWNPSLSIGATIYAALPRPDGTIDVGGDFTSIAGVARRGYARLRPLPIPPNGLDVDGSGTYDALSDGLIVLRYLFGLRGTALIAGVVGLGPAQSLATIEAHLDAIATSLDVDANGHSDALTDGILILRYLVGLRGSALISGAVGSGSSRTAEDIAAAIQALMP